MFKLEWAVLIKTLWVTIKINAIQANFKTET